MPVDAFQSHWRTAHAARVLLVPGLRSYVQSHTLRSVYAHREPIYDGVAEAWFDDVEALDELAESPEFSAVRSDEKTFIDTATLGSILTEEHAIANGAPPLDGVKNLSFLTRRHDMPPDRFQKYWRETHGPIAAAIPGIKSYVQSHSLHRDGEPAYDGVAITWFQSTDAMRRAEKSPEYAGTRADEANFLAHGEPPFVIAKEHTIL